MIRVVNYRTVRPRVYSRMRTLLMSIVKTTSIMRITTVWERRTRMMGNRLLTMVTIRMRAVWSVSTI